MTIKVPAGAVAADIEATTKLNSNDCPATKYTIAKTKLTTPNTSKIVIIKISLPTLFTVLIKNSPPILNAIADKQTSFTKLITGTSLGPMRLKKDGPKNKPPTKYPVTLGKLNLLATLPPINPNAKSKPNFI